MDVNREGTFFDQLVAAQGEYDVLGPGAYRRLLGVFKRLIAPQADERCVDLGCGTGAFTRRLRTFGLDLTGVDISPLSVAWANSRSTTERYIVGDIRNTGLPSDSFDIIVYSGVLHHCDARGARIATLREGRRLLKPSGRLFAYDPSAHSPSMWLYRDPRSPFHSTKGKTENEVLLHRQELEAELTEAGLQDVLVRGISGITFRYVESAAARVILPLYNLYEQMMRFPPLENRWGTFLVSFARKAA